jgi:hypothetical protein
MGVVAISLGACGSSTPAPTAAAACTDYATKICERGQACEPGLLSLFGYATPADCVSGQADACQRALAEPHTGYTPARAQACGDALGAMTCEEFLSPTTAPVCFPRGGTIAIGGSCSDGWQCASGTCYPGDFTGCGTCITPVTLGQDCVNTQCANNLVCSASSLVAPGNPVCTTPVGVGGACNDDGVCPANAHCDRTTHTCARLPAIGEACDSSTVFFCDFTTAAAFCDPTTSLCVAPVVVQPGETCPSSPTTCMGGVCIYDADAATATCIANGTGASCASSDQCAYGWNCVGGTCQPLVCDGTPTDGGATALVAVSPWSLRRPASLVDRSRRGNKLGGR